MRSVELTRPRPPMQYGRVKMCVSWVMLAAGAGAMGGCITVNAPQEPIVIELNINIKQEVIYRLAEDAGNTIEENPGIF